MLDELIQKLNENGGVARFFQRTEVEIFRQWYERLLKRYEEEKNRVPEPVGIHAYDLRHNNGVSDLNETVFQEGSDAE